MKKALYKQNETENNTVLCTQSNKFKKQKSKNLWVAIRGNLSHFRCLACWAVEFRDAPLENLLGAGAAGEVQKKYSRKGKLNEKKLIHANY